MCRQIRKIKLNKTKKKKRSYKKRKKKVNLVSYPGEQIQLDVKYVPLECIGFSSFYPRYYQITAIDVYSRKRILAIVNEKSMYTTSEFVKNLEKEMGFSITTVQTDNGREFCNDPEQTRLQSRFEKALKFLGIEHKRTAPYSPWQNAYVERSHREDEEKFYQKRRFKSEEEMIKANKRYQNLGNNTYRKVLGFKSPNKVIEEYFEQVA